MVRSNNTYWRKFWKGIDLDKNLQITLTSLAPYSLAIEIQMIIPKPFERFLSFSLKRTAIYTKETTQNAGFCVNIFQDLLTRFTALRWCAQASQNSGGLVQLFVLYLKDYFLKYLISNHVCHSKYLKWKLPSSAVFSWKQQRRSDTKQLLTKMIPGIAVPSEDLSHTTMTKVYKLRKNKKKKQQTIYICMYNYQYKITQNDKNPSWGYAVYYIHVIHFQFNMSWQVTVCTQ